MMATVYSAARRALQRAHLIRAPVPNGGGRLPEQEAQPRHLAVGDSSEHHEGLRVGEAAGAVAKERFVGDRCPVARDEASVAADFHEASRRKAKQKLNTELRLDGIQRIGP